MFRPTEGASSCGWLFLPWEILVAKEILVCRFHFASLPLLPGLPTLLPFAPSSSNFTLEETWGTFLLVAYTQGSILFPPMREQVGNECEGV